MTTHEIPLGVNAQTTVIGSPAVILLAIYLCGTLLLPIASFDRYRERADDWLYLVGTGIWFDNPLNRGLVLGIVVGVLALVNAFWSRTLPRWHWWDALICAWGLTPLVSGFANPSPLPLDLYQSLYLVAVWGGPYLAARLSVRTAKDAQNCLWMVVVLGLVTAVVALTEFIGGRFVYATLYGYHPNQEIGLTKFFGIRPLLGFEDPNQIAMWWLTVAVAAFLVIPKWFPMTRVTGVKSVAVALPFFYQGIGASALALLGYGVLTLRRGVRWKPLFVAIAAISFMGLLARGPILRLARDVVKEAGIEQPLKQVLRASAIGSFGWRLAREGEGSNSVGSYPLLGWGTVMFWENSGLKHRPWGFVSLVNGAYGLVGTAVVFGFFFLPVLSQWWADQSTRSRLTYGITVLWALHGVDAIMNPAFFLPVVFLFGTAVSVESYRTCDEVTD